MTKHGEQPSGDGGSSGGRIHRVQPERDLEANWEVDLANKLEEYLLKICSGEITGSEEEGHIPVNFAEAALLLQGSVQVYSRKVEYLYNLVLHALEFLSQKSQQDQAEGTPIRPEENSGHTVSDEENDSFWNLEDVAVDAKNCLDSSTNKDSFLNHFVKLPANLVVLEGDCLDTTGDVGELESYLLATSDLYRDFILLDPCDAVAVDNFLDGDEAGRGKTGAYKNSLVRKSFQSPRSHSGGTARKSSLGKNQDAKFNRSPNNCNVGPDHPVCHNFEDNQHGFDVYDGCSEPMASNDSDSDFDDNDNPWKPLNPHEPGNLKVKPFRKVKGFRRNRVKSMKISVTALFPLARMHGTVSPELNEIWEMHCNGFKRERESQELPLYEKLRQSLTNEECQTCDAFGNPEDENEDNGYDGEIPDFGQSDGDMPEPMHVDEDVLLHPEKNNDGAAHFDTNEAFDHEGPNSQASLEDLCRSHLDALLASIAETEKQTELAARVSSWKQKIEHNLEEQDSHSPFDIHEYGARILDKLSLEADSGSIMSFADAVKGQEKYDVARSFSAILQLVNNGDVDLDKGGDVSNSFCYTAENPFHIQLLRHDKRMQERQPRFSKKRMKSPTRNGSIKAERCKSRRQSSPSAKSFPEHGSDLMSSKSKCKISMNLRKSGGVRCTPEGKRRRRSRYGEPLDLNSAG